MVADGRKHFAYLCGRNSSWIDKQRRDWFGDALARHGLAFEAEAHGDYSYDSGFKEASLLLRRTRRLTHWCVAMTSWRLARATPRYVCLGRQVPGDLAIVGQDGIAMAAWECHDLTTLALDQVALIDAIVQLVERQETDNTAASTTVMKCTARWGSTA